jgi:conjugative transfer signal peptidase TraF
MAKTLKILISSFVALFLIVGVADNTVYQNISISEPLGYYLALPGIPVTRGDLVLTCITNKSYKKVFNALGMKDVSGQCDTGMPYLIKRVAAAKGDKVEITIAGVLINGVLFLNSKQFAEGRGVRLYPLPIGYSHVLGEDEYFMLGQSPHSVDSRYFGIVKKNDIFRRAFLIFKTGKPSIRNS